MIEFDRNEKRIVVSHARIWEQVKYEEKEAVAKEKKVEAAKTKKAVKDVQGKVEKTTLGDLGVLAELKKKMAEAGFSEIREQRFLFGACRLITAKEEHDFNTILVV